MTTTTINGRQNKLSGFFKSRLSKTQNISGEKNAIPKNYNKTNIFILRTKLFQKRTEMSFKEEGAKRITLLSDYFVSFYNFRKVLVKFDCYFGLPHKKMSVLNKNK